MALVLADRVKETSSTGGTGALTLAGAGVGYQTFSAGVGTGNTTYYGIADRTTGAWEAGIGTFTAPNTLSRDTVLASSNAGALVAFTAGNTKDVFVTQPSERAVYQDGSVIRAGVAVLGVVNGGTGAAALTGYVQGNGTGAMTASATIPNTDITGLGTMSTQNANTVAITGGAIDGTTVGGTTPAAGTFTTLTATGNLAFTGTGNRITGDFSNATVTSRVMLQTSTANGNTSLGVLPNGTGSISNLHLFSTADPTNASVLQLQSASTQVNIIAGITGTGTYLPLTFYAGGSEGMRLDTNRRFAIGMTPNSNSRFQVAQQVADVYTVDLFGLAASTSLRLINDLNTIERLQIAATNTYMTVNVSGNGEFARITSTGVTTLGGTSTAPAIRVTPAASQVNWLDVYAAATAAGPNLVANGSDANIVMNYTTKGAGAHQFYTGFGGTAVVQAAISHTASANRYITLTGSNGGNPTIGTSAGGLALAQVVFLNSGTTVTAGGAVAAGLGSNGPGIYFGSGIPTVSAAQGSFYFRTDGSSTTTRAYINTNGTTGWTSITTAA